MQVEAGITLSEIHEVLDFHGLAMSNLGSISEQSIAGAISTGTHGALHAKQSEATSPVFISCVYFIFLSVYAAGRHWLAARHHGNPSPGAAACLGVGGSRPCIAAAQSRCVVLKLSRIFLPSLLPESPGIGVFLSVADLFQAALCGLGSVGIITGVILLVTNAFDLHEVGRAVPLKTLLPEYMARARSHHFYRFWWFPHTDMCWEVTATPLKPAGVPGKRASRGACCTACCTPLAFIQQWFDWLRFTLFGFYLFQAALFVGVLIPAIIPYVNQLWRYVLFHVRREKIDRSDKVMNIDCLFKQCVLPPCVSLHGKLRLLVWLPCRGSVDDHLDRHVDEWSVPIRQLPQAMEKLQELIDRNGFHVHYPVEVRFVRGDDIWLSPAYGGDVAFIGIIMYKPFGATMDYRAYFDEYEKAMARLGGRPHWAKCFRLNEPDFRMLYPKWSLFKEVREDVDPDGVFVNQWVERVVLGDGSGPSGYLEDADPGSAASGGRL